MGVAYWGIRYNPSRNNQYLIFKKEGTRASLSPKCLGEDILQTLAHLQIFGEDFKRKIIDKIINVYEYDDKVYRLFESTEQKNNKEFVEYVYIIDADKQELEFYKGNELLSVYDIDDSDDYLDIECIIKDMIDIDSKKNSDMSLGDIFNLFANYSDNITSVTKWDKTCFEVVIGEDDLLILQLFSNGSSKLNVGGEGNVTDDNINIIYKMMQAWKSHMGDEDE